MNNLPIQRPPCDVPENRSHLMAGEWFTQREELFQRHDQNTHKMPAQLVTSLTGIAVVKNVFNTFGNIF